MAPGGSTKADSQEELGNADPDSARPMAACLSQDKLREDQQVLLLVGGQPGLPDFS
jgi:hypothetical protein